MSKQSHEKHEHEKHNHQNHGAPNKNGLHKDWRAWTAVILMLAAMAIYVMSNEESELPGGQQEQPVPEAAE